MSTPSAKILAAIDAKQLKEIRDFATAMPLILKLSRYSGLNNVGYQLKQETKKALTGNKLGWNMLSPHTPVVNAHPVKAKPRRPTGYLVSGEGLNKFWGAIANLPVYNPNYEESSMTFGFMEGVFGKKTMIWHSSTGTKKKRVDNFIGSEVMRLAKALTEGYTISDAELDETGYGLGSMRRYLASVGVFIPRGKGGLVFKPRPLIGPVVMANSNNIPTWFQAKFWQKIEKLCNDPVWCAMIAGNIAMTSSSGSGSTFQGVD